MKRKDGVMLRLIREARPIAKWLALGAVLNISAVCCAVAAPKLLGELVQSLYDYWKSGSAGAIRVELIPGLLTLAAIYGGYGLFSYLNMYLMNWAVSAFYTCGLRIRISEKLKRLPVRYVDQTPVGDILNRMTDDVSVYGSYVHDVFDMVIQGAFQITLTAVMLFRENWLLAIFVVLLTPLSVLLSAKIASFTDAAYEKMFTQSGKLSEIVEESFSNYPTTKAFNLEEYTEEKHKKANEQLRKDTARANFLGSIVQPIIKLSNTLAYILISLVGGWLLVEKGVNVGVVVTVVLYARQFASPLEQLAFSLGAMNRVKAAGRRIFQILDMDEEQENAVVPMETPKGHVEFQNVEFAYKPEEPLITNLNLSVQPGQKVAIVGPTGAGKTTIVNLLMRFYDPVSGKILLDGQNTGEISREQVRSNIGMVLQDTWLFRGTIAENVAYGQEGATLEDVQQACQKAYCDHFIRTMPNGYDTVIGDDTTNLSGGQKQLLTIARALLADRPLLILDEATSNVDTRTEVLIQKAMDKLMEGKTCFVIAHRLSTIVDSDLILVLDKGHIVEQGTHRQLLAQKGFYYKLYTSQYAV